MTSPRVWGVWGRSLWPILGRICVPRIGVKAVCPALAVRTVVPAVHRWQR